MVLFFRHVIIITFYIRINSLEAGEYVGLRIIDCDCDMRILNI